MTDAPAPRSVLEALKDERGLTWREVARLIEREGVPISADHVRRVATGVLASTPKPALARAIERAFGGVPIETLLGGPDPTLTRPAAAGLPDTLEAIEMAAEKMRRLGLSITPIDDYRLLEDELRDLARAYPVRALTELINPMVTLQETVADTITNPSRPGDGQRLYGVAAITGGLLAKASHDLGNPRSATTQARTALVFADHVGDPALTAWLNGLLALVAYWDGRARDSLEHANRGLAVSENTTAALWLHASAARAWARLGNVEEAVASVHAVEATSAAMEPTDLDAYGGILTFSAARATYYAADAFAWLPAHADAERVALDAVAAFSDPTHEDWAFGDAAGAACDLAIIRIRRGEIEGAAEALSAVLDLPREQRIGGIIKSVQRVSDALAEVPDSGARRVLAEQLDTYVRRPMVLQA